MKTATNKRVVPTHFSPSPPTATQISAKAAQILRVSYTHYFADPGTGVYTCICSIWYCQIWYRLDTYRKHPSNSLLHWLLSYCTITYEGVMTSLMTPSYRQRGSMRIHLGPTDKISSLWVQFGKVFNQCESADFMWNVLLSWVYCA